MSYQTLPFNCFKGNKLPQLLRLLTQKLEKDQGPASGVQEFTYLCHLHPTLLGIGYNSKNRKKIIQNKTRIKTGERLKACLYGSVFIHIWCLAGPAGEKVPEL